MILLIQQEWPSWQRSRSWSYTAHAFSYEEGLKANEKEYFTLTTPWLDETHKLCAGKSFEQAWIFDVTHLEAGEEFWQWLVDSVPVRVGFVIESLEYTPAESNLFLQLQTRKAEVLEKVKYFTHLVLYDEKDAADLKDSGTIPAFWNPTAVPGRFIARGPNFRAGAKAFFGGSVYGTREHWFANPLLEPLLTRQESLEDDSIYPSYFSFLNYLTPLYIQSRLQDHKQMFSAYLESLRLVRQESFALWLEGMGQGGAVVNLPSVFKGYAGRVFEGMAAGCPVISCPIPERPKTAALFVDEREILLFDPDDPEMLACQIKRIRDDAGLAKRLAGNAQARLRSSHTSELRVKQILNWVSTGAEPDFI